jgi:hypothetical protein
MDGKYLVRYTVGGNAAAKALSLEESGPLYVGPQHFLAVTLDSLVTRFNNDVEVSVSMIEYIIGGSALLDRATHSTNFLWHLTVARAGKFFSDADTAGISWDVVTSASLPEGVEELRARFSALELPALERAIHVADMMVVTPPASVADTYLVKTTIGMIVASDAEHSAAFQFKSLLIGHLSTASIDTSESADVRATLEVIVGRTVVGMPAVTVASLFADKFRRTRQPKGYTIFPAGYAAVLIEITRRSSSAQTDLFYPLFERSWRSACPNLSSAFFGPCQGDEAWSLTLGLGPCVGVTDVTKVTAASIDAWVGDALHILDTATLRLASNEVRQRALLKHGGYSGQAPTVAASAERDLTPGSDTKLAAGVWKQVAIRPSYKALVTLVEPLLVTPITSDNNIKVAQAMAADVEPTGRFILLGGKPPADLEPWRHCTGAVAVLQEAFEATTAALVASKTERTPGTLLAAGAARKLISGCISLTELDYWLLVRTTVGVIHGEHVLLRPENADPPSKAAFFCSPTLMRLAEPVLSVLFTQAGWSGRSAGSFLSLECCARSRSPACQTTCS